MKPNKPHYPPTASKKSAVNTTLNMMVLQGMNNNSMLNASFMSNNSSGIIGSQNAMGYATSRDYTKPQLDLGLLMQPGAESQQQNNGTPTLNNNIA